MGRIPTIMCHPEGRPSIKSPINYSDFLESPPPVPWEADARTWGFTHVGPQAFDLLGFPVEDWYDLSFWTRQIHPDDRLSAITTRTRLSAEGGSCEFTYRMVRSDGEVIWVSDIVALEIGDDGSHALRGFLIDITERMALETSLGESENLLRRILNEAPDALLRVHTDGTILQANRQAEELFGLSHDELVGSPIERFLPGGLSGKHAGYRKATGQGPLPRSMGAGRETAARTADGSETPVRVTVSPIEYGGGLQILARIRDLGEPKRMEEDLSVAAMGELTASLAHELNQPLSAIVANAQAASRFLAVTSPDLGEVDDALGDIAGDAKRAGEVIRHMRDFLREGVILPVSSSDEDHRQE